MKKPNAKANKEIFFNVFISHVSPIIKNKIILSKGPTLKLPI